MVIFKKDQIQFRNVKIAVFVYCVPNLKKTLKYSGKCSIFQMLIITKVNE